MSGRLVVCPTPIGNLEDITLRTLAVLGSADVIACEDTRHTRVLLERHGIRAPLVSYHEHNERARAGELVQRIRDGAVVALVSDAGMPLVSDPGFVVVQEVVAAELAVEVLPGPSSVLVALVASALPSHVWRFAGFLPRKAGELRELFGGPDTLVAFESPRRVGASLAVLAGLDPDRPVAVCRELTKLHEEVVRGTAGDLAARYAREAPRGEVVLVVGGAPAGADAAAGRAVDAVRRLVDAGTRPRAAAGVVAELTGARANDLYAAVLEAPDPETGPPDVVDWEARRRDVADVARRVGFSASDAELLARTARPAGRLVADPGRAPARGGSKLGGIPDLPADVPWPVGTHGPMGFVAQIDLALTSNLDGVDGWGASDRLLLFFADGDLSEGFVQAGAVIAVAPPGAGPIAEPPAAPPALGEVALRLEAVMTPVQEFRLEDQAQLDYDADTDDWATWVRLYEELGCGSAAIDAGHHQLLGNPWVIGSLDPVMMGGVVLARDDEDPDAESSPFRLLAQFTSDPDAGIEIADAGAIYFIVRAADIASGDYADVTAIIESH